MKVCPERTIAYILYHIVYATAMEKTHDLLQDYPGPHGNRDVCERICHTGRTTVHVDAPYCSPRSTCHTDNPGAKQPGQASLVPGHGLDPGGDFYIQRWRATPAGPRQKLLP